MRANSQTFEALKATFGVYFFSGVGNVVLLRCDTLDDINVLRTTVCSLSDVQFKSELSLRNFIHGRYSLPSSFIFCMESNGDVHFTTNVVALADYGNLPNIHDVVKVLKLKEVTAND